MHNLNLVYYISPNGGIISTKIEEKYSVLTRTFVVSFFSDCECAYYWSGFKSMARRKNFVFNLLKPDQFRGFFKNKYWLNPTDCASRNWKTNRNLLSLGNTNKSYKTIVTVWELITEWESIIS